MMTEQQILQLLYHYERKQGTTTYEVSFYYWFGLYHYERKQGTTTCQRYSRQNRGLYHYERKLGTTTYAIEPHPHRGKRSGVERGQCRAGNYGVWNWSLKSYRWTDKIPRQNGRPRRFLHAGVRRFLLTLTKLSVLSTPAAMSANLKCSIGIIKADLIFPCYFLSFACGVGVLWYNYFVRL